MAKPVLTKFLASLKKEDAKMFLSSISEEERWDFCESKDEYRNIFGEDPGSNFPKSRPEYQSDVKFSEVREKRIKERFKDLKKMFPQDLSLDGLKNKVKDMEEPKGGSMLKSIDDLRAIAQPSVVVNISLQGSNKEKSK